MHATSALDCRRILQSQHGCVCAGCSLIVSSHWRCSRYSRRWSKALASCTCCISCSCVLQTELALLLQGNKSPMGTPNQAWLALDLLSTLSFLYEAGHGAAVRQILELPLAQCPEVLVLGFASARRSAPLSWQTRISVMFFSGSSKCFLHPARH